MSRKYEKVSELLPIIKDLTAQGKTQQIAEQLGLVDKKVVCEYSAPDELLGRLKLNTLVAFS